VGQFTDDDLLRSEGNYGKFLGTTQKRYGNRKEEVGRWVKQWYQNDESQRAARKTGT